MDIYENIVLMWPQINSLVAKMCIWKRTELCKPYYLKEWSQKHHLFILFLNVF